MGKKKLAGSRKKVKDCCPSSFFSSSLLPKWLAFGEHLKNLKYLPSFFLKFFISPISNPSTFQFLKCQLVYLFILTIRDRVVWHVDSPVCALSKDLRWQPITPPHIERWDRSSIFLLILVSGSARWGRSPRPPCCKCRQTSGSEFDQIGRSWCSGGQDLQLG